MQGKDLKTKLTVITVAVSLAMLAVWAGFLLHTASGLRAGHRQNMQQASQQIMGRLERELLGLESAAFSLAGHPAVAACVTPQPALALHRKTAQVDELLQTLGTTTDFAQHLVLYTGDGVPASFMGSLGSTALGQLSAALEGGPLPRYTALALEDVRYILYAQPVAGGGRLVLLAQEDRLLGLFSPYTATGELQVSLAEEGVLVTSSDPALAEQTTARLEAEAAMFLRRSLGFTPFEIYISIPPSSFTTLFRSYAVGAALSAGLLAGLLALFWRTAARSFFRPMLGVMQDVERLGTPGGGQALQPTGEPGFDGLVEQVNHMLRRLEERSRALLAAQAALQQVELERKTALIIALKKQINAHFTVNVLNNIKVLAQRGDSGPAALMADGLSHLLRYANGEDEFVGGQEEWFILEKYGTVMENRYPGRFRMELDWDDRLEGVRLPRMLVQPLVENAILHGIVPRPGPGLVEVEGHCTPEGGVRIQVRDNGVGIPPPQLARLRGQLEEARRPAWSAGGLEHIALVNVQRRLCTYYPPPCGVDIQSGPGGTTVTLCFPAGNAEE